MWQSRLSQNGSSLRRLSPQPNWQSDAGRDSDIGSPRISARSRGRYHNILWECLLWQFWFLACDLHISSNVAGLTWDGRLGWLARVDVEVKS